jgi:hypothetical protein
MIQNEEDGTALLDVGDRVAEFYNCVPTGKCFTITRVTKTQAIAEAANIRLHREIKNTDAVYLVGKQDSWNRKYYKYATLSLVLEVDNRVQQIKLISMLDRMFHARIQKLPADKVSQLLAAIENTFRE